jgi:hypothetical protein
VLTAPLDLVQETSVLVDPQLVVSPVGMTLPNVLALEDVAVDTPIREGQDKIMVRAEELDRQRYCTLLVTLAPPRLLHDKMLEPRVVWAAVILKTEVPL